MPMTFVAGRGASAQQLTRIGSAVEGTYVFPSTAGGAVTPSSGMTVAVAAINAGEVTINGTVETTAYAGGTVALDASDPTNPRVDALYYDQTGAVGKTTGAAVAVTSTTGPVAPNLDADQILIAQIYVAASETTIDASDITDMRQGLQSTYANTTVAYKSAAQTFSANTTFANITATSGNLAFAIAANETWRAKWVLPITTGAVNTGAKVQLTGPGTPTFVSYVVSFLADQTFTGLVSASNSGGTTQYTVSASAFSTSLGTTSVGNIANGNATGFLQANSAGAFTIVIDALIINGANAGTVTLQGAQNAATSTTDFAAGCYMVAERVA